MYEFTSHISREDAFSLLELLIVIFLIVVLSSVSVAFGNQWYARHTMQDFSYRLWRQLSDARLLAIQQRQAVTLCPTIDQQFCGQDWSHGILTFIDENQNGQREATESILSVLPRLSPQESLSWQGVTSDSYLSFYPDFLHHMHNGKFIYRIGMDDAFFQSEVIVNRVGRSRIQWQNSKQKILALR